MSSGHKLASSAAVLRNVTMQELPHALARPRLADVRHQALGALTTVAPPGPPDHPLQPRGFDEGVAAGHSEGMREGMSTGRAAQLAETEAWLQETAAAARREASEEGYADGMRRASEEAEEAVRRLRLELSEQADAVLAEHARRMEQLMQSLSAQAQALVAQAEDDLVAMSYEVICRILGERAVTPAAIRDMVEHLLSQRERKPVAAAHVHPDDFAYLKLEAAAAVRPDWQWVADDTVKLGGVLLRSAHGSLDARLEIQLEALAQALLQARTQRRGQAPHLAAAPAALVKDASE